MQYKSFMDWIIGSIIALTILFLFLYLQAIAIRPAFVSAGHNFNIFEFMIIRVLPCSVAIPLISPVYVFWKQKKIKYLLWLLIPVGIFLILGTIGGLIMGASYGY